MTLPKRRVRLNHFTKWPREEGSRVRILSYHGKLRQGARLKQKGLPAEVGGSNTPWRPHGTAVRHRAVQRHATQPLPSRLSGTAVRHRAVQRHATQRLPSRLSLGEHRGNALVCVWECLPKSRTRSTRFKRRARPLGEVVKTYTSLSSHANGREVSTAIAGYQCDRVRAAARPVEERCAWRFAVAVRER